MKKSSWLLHGRSICTLVLPAHCQRCILLRYHRWLQLSLAAWRKETNILFFISLVKHFIHDNKIIASLGQEGVGLETGPSSVACTYHLGPKLPAFACCLFTMKNETVTFSLVTFTRNGYTHQKKKINKGIFMFVFKNGHRGAILNVRRHSIRECGGCKGSQIKMRNRKKICRWWT